MGLIIHKENQTVYQYKSRLFWLVTYCIELSDPLGVDGFIMLRSHSSLIALKKELARVFFCFLSSE